MSPTLRLMSIVDEARAEMRSLPRVSGISGYESFWSELELVPQAHVGGGVCCPSRFSDQKDDRGLTGDLWVRSLMMSILVLLWFIRQLII